MTFNPSRLEKQRASSIARQLTYNFGAQGAARKWQEMVNGATNVVQDCDGNEYVASNFTVEDLELLKHYLEKQRVRVAKFLGVKLWER